MGEVMNMKKKRLDGNHEGKISLGRPRRKLEDNVRMCLGEIG
jgi:hypothetical protein